MKLKLKMLVFMSVMMLIIVSEDYSLVKGADPEQFTTPDYDGTVGCLPTAGDHCTLVVVEDLYVCVGYWSDDGCAMSNMYCRFNCQPEDWCDEKEFPCYQDHIVYGCQAAGTPPSFCIKDLSDSWIESCSGTWTDAGLG